MRKYFTILYVVFYFLPLSAQIMYVKTLTDTHTIPVSDIIDITFSDQDSETVADIDGNIYRTVKIGDQIWMAENLRVTRYRNGESLLNITESAAWRSISTGAYCSYNNDESKNASYGRLYNWYVVNDARNIAPLGWHVPNETEMSELIRYLGGEQISGGKLKEQGDDYWASPNINANNESNFTARGSGLRNPDNGEYFSLHEIARFWASTEDGICCARYMRLDYNNSFAQISGVGKRAGYSIRCVKDN